MKNRKMGNILAAILSVVMITVTAFSYPIQGQALGEKKLTLPQAQSLAAAADKNYKRIYNRITLKEIRYVSAMKAAQIKQKSNSTYNWSPLLNFQLPQQATLEEEYQWQYQPIQLQSEINSLKHQLTDCLYETEKETALLYLQAYVCQEKIVLLEEQLDTLQENLKRNRANTVVGTGTQSQVESTEQSIENVNNSLALQMRTLQTALESMSEQINLDVTEGYVLQSPISEVSVQREDLEKTIEHTLENDQSYYEAKLAESAAYMSLITMEGLMQSKYGSDMESLQIYINQAKNGEELDEGAFKASFDEFLENIDSAWEGEQEILSVKVSKEWFQGTEGSFYLEDDPYALYTAALEYKEALCAKEEAKEALTGQVKEAFEALITVRNTYETAKKAEESLEQDIIREEQLSRLGKSTEVQETDTKQEEYSRCKMECLDALEAYGKQLEEYNRLTCGGLEDLTENSGVLGAGIDDLVEGELLEGAYYSIDYRIEDRIFFFGIQIPENFSVGITAYELYVNGVKIGEKTEAADQIKHLALDFAQIEQAQVYLYQGEELYSVCEIDPYTGRGTLEITGGYQLKSDAEGEDFKNRETLASFSYKTDKDKKLTTLHISPRKQDIAYYALTVDGRFLYSEEPVSVKEDYQYISALSNDLNKINVYFYDKQKELLYQGEFNTLHNCIYQKAEEQ